MNGNNLQMRDGEAKQGFWLLKRLEFSNSKWVFSKKLGSRRLYLQMLFTYLLGPTVSMNS